MTGRGQRARAAISYNEKTSSGFEPAWLQSIKPAKSDTPPKKEKIKPSAGSAEKENAKHDVAKPKSSKPQKTSSKEKIAVVASTKTKHKKASAKAEKATTQAARGRNAGVTVVAIVDQKARTPHISGLRKPTETSSKPLPLPPAQPKAVPGLPGVVQKPSVAPTRPNSVKRKAPAPPPVAIALDPSSSSDDDPLSPTPPAKQQQVSSRAPPPPPPPPQSEVSEPAMVSQSRSTKRSKKNPAPPPPTATTTTTAPPPPSARARSSHRYHQPQQRPLPPPASTEIFRFSPLPSLNGVERELEESRRNFDALQTIYLQLQEENTALKTVNIRDQVEELIAQQGDIVLEHGAKASEVAAHWREEAEKMAALLAESRVEELAAQNRSVRAELATARQALLDTEVEKTEREKTVVQLQKRNTHLERYARMKPAMANKCIGTGDAGVHVMQARAMAPEGAAGSSLYVAAHGGGYVSTMNITGLMGLGVDAPYSLRGQRTVAHAATAVGDGRGTMVSAAAAAAVLSGSDMHLASNHNHAAAGGGGDNLTASSVQGQGYNINAAAAAAAGVKIIGGRLSMRGRRVSAPVGPVNLLARPGQTAADVSRQIQFYSNALSAVNEEAEEEEYGPAADAVAAPAPVVAAAAPVLQQQQQQEDPSSVAQHQPIYQNQHHNHQQQQQQGNSGVAPSTGPLSRGQALLLAAHLDAKPLKGGKFLFTHDRTGYRFVLGHDPDPDDPRFNMRYQPISLGTAEPALREVGGDLLVEEAWFVDEQVELFSANVMRALGLSVLHMNQQQ